MFSTQDISSFFLQYKVYLAQVYSMFHEKISDLLCIHNLTIEKLLFNSLNSILLLFSNYFYIIICYGILQFLQRSQLGCR